VGYKKLTTYSSYYSNLDYMVNDQFLENLIEKGHNFTIQTIHEKRILDFIFRSLLLNINKEDLPMYINRCTSHPDRWNRLIAEELNS